MSDDSIREQPLPAGSVAVPAWAVGSSARAARTPPGAMGSRFAWLVLGIGVATIAGYYYVDDNGQNYIYSSFGVVATLAACGAASRSGGRTRLIWSFFAAGIGIMAVADTLLNYELTGLTWPDWPDYVYLLSLLPLFGGVIVLAWGLAAADRAAAAVDAAIVTGAVVVAEWVFVAGPVVHRHDNTIGGELVLLVYCAGDLFILMTLSRFAVRGMRLGASHWLVAGAILAWTIADEGAFLSPAIPFDTSWADTFWLLAYVLWAAAAIVPSSVDLGRVVEREAPDLSLWRVPGRAGAADGSRDPRGGGVDGPVETPHGARRRGSRPRSACRRTRLRPAERGGTVAARPG
ncbi:MAG TPA: hypothetical protein VHS03_07795 [Gaiellaceae bacterium]|nr:hypothetical protein [Gaiellaceae bacterium]